MHLERLAKTRVDPTKAGVAQLVEQLIRNQQVTSSSLIVGSTIPPFDGAGRHRYAVGLATPRLTARLTK